MIDRSRAAGGCPCSDETLAKMGERMVRQRMRAQQIRLRDRGLEMPGGPWGPEPDPPQQPVINNPPPPPPPGPVGNVTQVSAFGITVKFGTTLQAGEYLYEGSGLFYVVAPGGMPVVEITPAYQNRGTVTVKGKTTTWHANGAQRARNPRFNVQSLDSTVYMHFAGSSQSYDHEFNISAHLPQTIPAGDTLQCAQSKGQPGQRSQIYSMLFITVVAAAPALGPSGGFPFRPHYCRNPNPPSTRAPELRTTDDIDWSRVPSIAIPPDPNHHNPPWSAVKGAVDGCWYDGPREFMKRYSRPELHQLNYGRDIGSALSAVFAKVMLAYPQADKEKTVWHLVQLGLDHYWLSKYDRWGDEGSKIGVSKFIGHFNMDAGQGHLEKLLILFAGLLLHDNDMLDEVKYPTPGNVKQYWIQDNQMGYVDGTLVGKICGYGVNPPGSGNPLQRPWTPNGTPEWGISWHLDIAFYGHVVSNMAAWNPDADGMHGIGFNSHYPLQSNGQPCPNVTSNYRTCCTANIWHVLDWLMRVWHQTGVLNYADYFSTALCYYLKDRYLQTNLLWGLSPTLLEDTAVNFFTVKGGDVTHFVWFLATTAGPYIRDYATWPPPPP